MARILLVAFAIVIVTCPAMVEAKNASGGAGLRQCVLVVRHAGGDMLENRCGGCRLVSVQRTRPGVGKPTAQTLTVPEKTRQPLPFRGPGRTRITAEQPCPGVPSVPLRTGAGAERQCVRFLDNRMGGAALVNPCTACRAVEVELVDTAGNRIHRAFAIAPGAPLHLPPAGLATARILADTPCG